MRLIDTRMVIGLAAWIMGFALMTAGWLIEQLFEQYGNIPAKILYKTGAFVVAMPVIVGLWKASGYIYSHRVDIVVYVNEAFRFVDELLRVF